MRRPVPVKKDLPKTAKCPICKSGVGHLRTFRQNNGIIGPGYRSWITDQYYSCDKCRARFDAPKEGDRPFVIDGPKTRTLRPCDCKDQAEAHLLQEQGIKHNDEGITINPNYVLIEVGSVTLKVSMQRFKQWAEWYLEPQDIEPIP